MKVYQRIASLLDTIRRCEAPTANASQAAHAAQHRESLHKLVAETIPSGSGLDTGARLDVDASTTNRLIFDAHFHHMNDVGMYAGWSDHTVFVTPDLAYGFRLKVTGRDRNDVKEYIAGLFHDALNVNLPPIFP